MQLYYTAWGPASLVQTEWATPRPSEESSESDSRWRWEEGTLYHFTMPGPGSGIADSQVGRKLWEIYHAGPDLLATDASGTEVRVYASFTGASYDINSWQRAQQAELENADLNFLPEPSPLALLVTGLVCIFLAKGFRRYRRIP